MPHYFFLGGKIDYHILLNALEKGLSQFLQFLDCTDKVCPIVGIKIR